MYVDTVCGQYTEGPGVHSPSVCVGIDRDTLYQAVASIDNANRQTVISEQQAQSRPRNSENSPRFSSKLKSASEN